MFDVGKLKALFVLQNKLIINILFIDSGSVIATPVTMLRSVDKILIVNTCII